MQLCETDKRTDAATVATGIPSEMAAASTVCLRHRIAFAVFRLPGEDCRFFSNPSGASKVSAERFGVAMWGKAFGERSVIENELDAAQTLAIGQDLIIDNSAQRITPWPVTTDRNDYNEGLMQLIGRLKERGGKTVISRVVTTERTLNPEQWVEIADRVFSGNPSALCCLYYTAETGAWICASPEILLDADFADQTIHTIALAGTRRRDNGSDKEWSIKDVNEHDVVKQFISDKLDDLGAETQMSATETSASGAIEHLRTSFRSKMPEGFRPADFLDIVSPTPALCGYPTDIAKEEIKLYESHQRYCYGGYITLETPERTVAYVNIRCVHFDSERMTQYAGSGIMPDSTADGEWDETEAKLGAIGRYL